MKKTLLGGAMLLPFTSHAAIILDGSRDVDYGPALAVQTVQTQFGDANPNNGSELNAAYARVSGGTLHLLITGNLESNFNKLNIFIDSIDGGQSVIGGTNPANDNWAGRHNGLTFDNGFTADFLLISRNGNGNQFDLDYAVLGTETFEAYGNVFSGALTGISGPLGTTGIAVAFDNSNIAGVTGGTGAADQAAAAAVTTGLEYFIPLSAIGNPTGDIRISAMVNNGDHNYLSNQFLGGLPAGQGNLGGDGAGGFNGTLSEINLNNFAGNQFFTVAIPEPSAALLGAFGLLGLLRRRR